jgi:hypothetical protein
MTRQVLTHEQAEMLEAFIRGHRLSPEADRQARALLNESEHAQAFASEIKHEIEVLNGDLECRTNCLEHLVESARLGRRPVLVLGAGLFAQVGAPGLASWSDLLEVAWQRLLPGAVSPNKHWLGLAPTHAWEWLVWEYASRYSSPSTPRAEEEAQRRLCDLAKQLVKQHTASISPELAPGVPAAALLDERLDAIVSLNFFGWPFESQLSRPSGAAWRRVRHVRGTNLPVFYPHGDVSHPKSLALGMRKYAERTHQWEKLRGELKGLERTLGYDERPLPREARQSMIHHALTSPLVFAGCGLHHAESALWWLLATRARNCAKRVPVPTPLGYFLTAVELTPSQEMRLEAVRCVPIRLPSFDAVWAMALDIIDALPDRAAVGSRIPRRMAMSQPNALSAPTPRIRRIRGSSGSPGGHSKLEFAALGMGVCAIQAQEGSKTTNLLVGGGASPRYVRGALGARGLDLDAFKDVLFAAMDTENAAAGWSRASVRDSIRLRCTLDCVDAAHARGFHPVRVTPFDRRKREIDLGAVRVAVCQNKWGDSKTAAFRIGNSAGTVAILAALTSVSKSCLTLVRGVDLLVLALPTGNAAAEVLDPYANAARAAKTARSPHSVLILLPSDFEGSVHALKLRWGRIAPSLARRTEFLHASGSTMMCLEKGHLTRTPDAHGLRSRSEPRPRHV